MVIGIVHPGAMGSAVGAELNGNGHQLLWAGAGRSRETRDRARAAGFADVLTLPALCTQAELILSICPPHAAIDVARSVRGFSGIYVDANAISPATTQTVAAALAAGSPRARFVDGGIVGPPPRSGVSPDSRSGTRLYLSGADTPIVSELFAETAVGPRVVSAEVGAASAVKMAYAAWTKGRAALLLATRSLAEREGIAAPLLDEWKLSQETVLAELEQAGAAAHAKGWRWSGEMEQIAQTFAAAGLPDGFHLAAAEVYAGYPRPQAG